MIRAARSRMRSFNYVWASAFSLVWPATLVIVPLAITFHSARVYATTDSGAPPPACSSAELTSCSGAAANQACACAGECACARALCSGDGGAGDALVCKPVVTCQTFDGVAACKGKTAGASCSLPDLTGAPLTGTCNVLAGGCLEKGEDGFYKTIRPLGCAITIDGDARSNDGADAGAQAPGDEGSSGCSAAPGTSAPSGLCIGLPLGLALVVMRCLRRRTK